MIAYREKMAEIIRAGGGIVEDDRFVTRPGVMVMSASESTPEARRLLDEIGLDADLSDTPRLAAFDARLTYLNFPETDARTGNAYLAGVVDERGHTSVTARGHASILFAGISLGDSIELIAGRAGRSARLTSSHTRAQDDPLYCLRGTREQMTEQRRLVERLIAVRETFSPDAVGGQYALNEFHPTVRATAIHIGMCLEDWHNIFRGRLRKQGNEPGVREMFARACALLHARFPHVVAEPKTYGYEEASP